MASRPIILFIDAYDSFSNNIISLLETTLDVVVRKIKIDNDTLKSDAALYEELRHCAAVVCGPGPGHPENEKDVGIMRRIWRLRDEEILPVLGICMGFQSLCLEFGAKVRKLKGPQHGMVRMLDHVGILGPSPGHSPTIFDKVGTIKATLYQSLCVDIGQEGGRYESDVDWLSLKWEPMEFAPELIPLAWACDLSANDMGIRDRRVLLAVQHKTKPFWGLQYHPESIRTNHRSKRVIINWFNEAQSWNKTYRNKVMSDGCNQFPHQQKSTKDMEFERSFYEQESLLRQYQTGTGPLPTNINFRNTRAHKDATTYHSRTIQYPPNVTALDIVEALRNGSEDQILLESSNSCEKAAGTTDVKGRYTILGLNIAQSTRFEYFQDTKSLRIIYPTGQVAKVDFKETNVGGVWSFLAKWLDDRRFPLGRWRSPFLGGFMGYTTYELGLETIGIEAEPATQAGARRPDLCFAWVERSVVIDHWENLIYVQCLTEKPSRIETRWIEDILFRLSDVLVTEKSFNPLVITLTRVPREININLIAEKIKEKGFPEPLELKFDRRNRFGVVTALYTSVDEPWTFVDHLNDMVVCKKKIRARILSEATENTKIGCLVNGEPAVYIKTPQHEVYQDKVLQCQAYIGSGDAYELCLTDQTEVTVTQDANPLSSWELYKALRKRQPAPFAAFIKLGNLTFISASPERFLKWDENGECELRPMKGTVKKTPLVSTLKQAEAMLNVPKELAENLMIVDLVRHDLFGICGSGNVTVPKLMVIEEYQSVFQMISIIRGQVTQPAWLDKKFQDGETDLADKRSNRYTGIDVLAASLPPGSMTGAPKKRSCEILQEIEGGKRRGLYSGVVGYMDVAGRGDWSVNIRCMFKWDEPEESSPLIAPPTIPMGQFGNRWIGVFNSSSEDVSNDFPNDISKEVPRVTNTWTIGAGGAVTILSTAQAEMEEMLTKLQGTLGLFEN